MLADDQHMALAVALGLAVVAWLWRVVLRKRHQVVVRQGGVNVLQPVPLGTSDVLRYSAMLVAAIGLLYVYFVARIHILDLPAVLFLACIPVVCAEDGSFGTIGLPAAVVALALPLLALPAMHTTPLIFATHAVEAVAIAVLARYALEISLFDQAYVAVAIITMGTASLIAALLVFLCTLSRRSLPLSALLGAATLLTSSLFPSLI
jgi:hypothetical protein